MSLRSDVDFHEAFNVVRDGVVILDASLRIRYVNPTALNVFTVNARPGDALDALTVRARFVGEDMTPGPSLLERVRAVKIEDRAHVRATVGVINGGSGCRWIEYTVARFGAEQMLLTFRDVSELKASVAQTQINQNELIDQKQFLDTTLNALPCLVSYVDRDYVYRYCNKAYQDWFGVRSDHVVGQKVRSFIGDRAFDHIRPHLDRGLAGHVSTFDAELEYRLEGRKNVTASYIPAFDPQGRTLGVYCIIHDVTSHLLSRRLLTEKEREIRKIINNVPGFISWWDKDQRNLHANRAYASYLGRAPEDIRGRTIRELVSEPLYDQNKANIEAVLKGEAQTFERIIEVEPRGTRHILTSYVPDVDGGEVRGFFATSTDVSRLKEAEASQRRAEARLVANAKMAALGEMAGGIAHEINNPLAIIHGKAGQLQRAWDNFNFAPEVVRDGIAKIEATAERISKIVKGLRSFSRNADLDPMTVVELQKIVSETLELVSERFKKENVALQVHVDPALTLECRSVEISQVLMNLLTNGLHAVQNLGEKWIRLEASAAGESVVVTVTDSGAGIPSEVAVKMMQPFFTTKDAGKGTGLGLSISKGIAETHGGTLRFDPAAPHTCFVLELPRRLPGYLK